MSSLDPVIEILLPAVKVKESEVESATASSPSTTMVAKRFCISLVVDLSQALVSIYLTIPPSDVKTTLLSAIEAIVLTSSVPETVADPSKVTLSFIVISPPALMLRFRAVEVISPPFTAISPSVKMFPVAASTANVAPAVLVPPTYRSNVVLYGAIPSVPNCQ